MENNTVRDTEDKNTMLEIRIKKPIGFINTHATSV